jgi:hypothetical protein
MGKMLQKGLTAKGLRRKNSFYDNSLDPFIPEYWAYESILILEENMVMGNLVHRDFSNIVANSGDTVNTRKPAEFVSKRKTNSDNVTVQDASATNIQVPLDQHIHVSFTIKDGEQSKAFKNLINDYMYPAMVANARMLDKVLCAQAIQFRANNRGGLGTMAKTNVQQYLVQTRDKLNTQKCYERDRNLLISSNAEAQMLQTDLFTQAQQVGDDGTALREASVGKKFGLQTFMDINTPGPTSGTLATATTTSAVAAAGAATVAITAARKVGQYVTIAGDNTPLRSTTATTTLTPTTKLSNAVASGAAVTTYEVGSVTGAYALGYSQYITVGGTGVPQVGQMVAFNSGDGATGTIRTPEYVIVDVTGSTILLDRPLETALANADLVCYGPNGDYNFAFHRNAIALVNRPLALPMVGVGARSAIVEHNDLSMRVTISYDGHAQGHLVTLDALFGVKALDLNLGCVLFG